MIAPIAAGEGPAQFEGSVTGTWGAPLRLKARISGAGLDADAEGSAEPWAQEPKANLSLKIRSADLGPLLDLKQADALAQNIGLSSRVTLAGNNLTFDDLDSSIAGSRLRGRLALTLGEEKNIEGEIGADQLALAPAFALAIGAGRTRCRRAARRRAHEGLARPCCVPGVARGCCRVAANCSR